MSRAPALRTLALLLLLVLTGPARLASAQEGGFVAEIPDLPLMPGLTELVDAGVVFDKPEGRIVEAYAQGTVTESAVVAFYAESLPQLGWRPEGAGYAREGESLTIEAVEGTDPLTLRFVLRPQ